MRVLNCVFLLAAFAAAVSADTTTEDNTAVSTANAIDATTTTTPSLNSGNENPGNTQDNDEFKIQPQPTRAPTQPPPIPPISPTPDKGTSSGGVPSNTPDETVVSSNAVAVAPTAFALVSAVIYAML